ncbi:uncharacterized protein [Centruroides vittatus]|uniref:uncharacterized protein n=1 Tax=Centruroides vittatus TaxID=120091 RepID=UPI00350EBB7C
MSGQAKRRAATNTIDSATLTVNEKILKECHKLYTDPEKGLVKIASSLGIRLLAPRKKVTVLLIGNHSAGKSTFVNWYIEEHIQKTGVAIETQGFTIVTSGKKRESLTGNATLHLYPYFTPLQKIKGLTDYLTTEISTSKQKKFSLVTFVDTPGLVDGDMKYPFDVNQAILFLGEVADLIFVFFDPIGQALCKRTLNLVEKLNAKHSDRIRMYLSKADEAGHESDRQKVLMQIVQELCKRPGLNKCGFDLPTIYVPHSNNPSRCVNRIEEVCKEIDRTINLTIQNTLNSLEYDCERIASAIYDSIFRDEQSKRENFRASGKGILLAMLGVVLPLLFVLNFLAGNVSRYVLGENLSEILRSYTPNVGALWKRLPSDYYVSFLIAVSITSVLFLILAKWYFRLKPTLTRKQKRTLIETKDYIQNYVKVKKQHLYQEYLMQSVADHDLA